MPAKPSGEVNPEARRLIRQAVYHSYWQKIQICHISLKTSLIEASKMKAFLLIFKIGGLDIFDYTILNQIEEAQLQHPNGT